MHETDATSALDPRHTAAMAPLDHLVLAVPSLDAGTNAVATATGAVPVFGGRHMGLGTMNQLVGLEGSAYLELITRDPDQPGGALADAVGSPVAPRLLTWACRSTNAHDVVSAARAAGLVAEATAMARARADGVVLRWTLVAIGGHPFAGAVPFFIDWQDSPHPTSMLAPELRLVSMVMETPDVAGLGQIHDALGVQVELAEAVTANLAVVLAGPLGHLALSGSPTGLVEPPAR